MLNCSALPGPAWVLLIKTFKPFRPTQYVHKICIVCLQIWCIFYPCSPFCADVLYGSPPCKKDGQAKRKNIIDFALLCVYFTLYRFEKHNKSVRLTRQLIPVFWGPFLFQVPLPSGKTVVIVLVSQDVITLPMQSISRQNNVGYKLQIKMQ